MGSLTIANDAANLYTKDETKKDGVQISKAMEKLEALYQNIPPDFEEELTFANLGGSFKFKSSMKANRKEGGDMGLISENSAAKSMEDARISSLARKDSKSTDSPVYSVDFEKALQTVKPPSQRQNMSGQNTKASTEDDLRYPSGRHSSQRALLKGSGRRNGGDPNANSDVEDVSNMFSDTSSNMAGSWRKSNAFSTELYTSYGSSFPVGNSKANRTDPDHAVIKRKGQPHTNICNICDKTLYFGKHRCLVCGRVYCKPCVGKGMGDMPEGRKCTSCVGHRFSQRYISQAGMGGCCLSLSNSVLKEEMKWAELGPRKQRNRPGISGMVTPSLSSSPMRSRPSRSPRQSSARVSPTRTSHPN